MQIELTELKSCALFRGIEADELRDMLACLSPVQRSYSKATYLLHAGESTTSLGVVLHGSVCVLREDFWGNRNIMSTVSAGDIFAESYACSPWVALGVSVVAEEATDVLWIETQRILTSCKMACERHALLLRNLLAIITAKNLRMSEKLAHMSQRSTREKLLSYLSAEAARVGHSRVTIPFNRQQLADYLSVERSAMSAELSRMRSEGLIDYRRNDFTLLESR